MVHGPWGSTFDGVGTLLFDVLPITIGASPLGQCHNLPLMTKMFLCGGACLYTAVTSSKIAREGLPSNGTSAADGGLDVHFVNPVPVDCEDNNM